jgi:hypothetical protein
MNYGPELALGRLPVKSKAEAEIVRLLSNPHSQITVGEAARLAKRTTTDRDILQSWILLGDPLIRLK